MRIVSFAWTSPALVAGFKTCTRRDWDARYAQTFHAGDLVQAYNRSPRKRGKQVAIIRLLQQPVYTPMIEMPDSDYQAEGFEWLLGHPQLLPKTVEGLPQEHFIRHVLTREGFERWRHGGGSMWVVRFELVMVKMDDGEGVKLLNQLLTLPDSELPQLVSVEREVI